MTFLADNARLFHDRQRTVQLDSIGILSQSIDEKIDDHSRIQESTERLAFSTTTTDQESPAKAPELKVESSRVSSMSNHVNDS